MNILIEGAGDAAWGTLLPYLRRAGTRLIGVDCHPLAFGLYAMDRGYLLPPSADAGYVKRAIDVCRQQKVGLVLPTQGPALQEWARRKPGLARLGIHVVTSPPETIALCQDKWETYRFFVAHRVPTPETSLEHEHEFIKPRTGEGGNGVFRAALETAVPMSGRLSQRWIEGLEFSVDALCGLDGAVLYVVVRERILVESGRSIISKVVEDRQIARQARRILRAARFIGPVNIQGFRTAEGIVFTEINPRISGGLSLSLAASENWFELIVRLLEGGRPRPKPVQFGMMTIRHLADSFVHERDLLKLPVKADLP